MYCFLVANPFYGMEKRHPFNKEYQTVVNREMDGLASHALRLIAVGYKPLTTGNIILHEERG